MARWWRPRGGILAEASQRVSRPHLVGRHLVGADAAIAPQGCAARDSVGGRHGARMGSRVATASRPWHWHRRKCTAANAGTRLGQQRRSLPSVEASVPAR